MASEKVIKERKEKEKKKKKKPWKNRTKYREKGTLCTSVVYRTFAFSAYKVI